GTVLLLAGLSQAGAQEQPTPTQDPIAPLLQSLEPAEQPSSIDAGEAAQAKRNTYLPAQDSYKVFVLGDSLAGGLFAGMERLTVGDKEIEVGGRFKEDSGIARPEFYDWNDA